MLKQVAAVYGFGDDESDLLHSFIREVIKKGVDNPAVQKSARNLMAQSKKKKNKPKVANPMYFAYAIRSAMRRTVGKKKVTKLMKKSEMSD